MKKAERILGIFAISLFSVGVLFKIMHWPGSVVMLTASAFLFNFGYLPLQIINERRYRTSLLEKAYMIFRFITLFIVVAGFLFKVLHWTGGGTLLRLGNILIPLFILFYFFLRIRGKGAIPFSINDLIIAILCYLIHIFVTQSMVPPGVVNGYIILNEHYEKTNAGLESANNLIYSSLDSVSDSGNQDLFKSINDLQARSRALCRLTDSLRIGFFASSTYGQVTDQFEMASTSRSLLADPQKGDAYFIKSKSATQLKSRINQYMKEITRIQKRHNLQLNLIGTGLDTEVSVNEWGKKYSWEQRMFKNKPVAAIVTNLSFFKQMVLFTESTLLNGLISQLDLSEETQLLQEMASRESNQAIMLKENEILRIKQQQELQRVQLEKSQTELDQRNTVTMFAFAGIAFVLILFFISTRAYLLKQKDNKKLAKQKEEITDKNDELYQQNEEIAAQRDEIEAQRNLVFDQKEQIEKTHNEISASIDYATRLQASILPDPGLIREKFSDHFILFRPRDKVSGDFYWWSQLEKQIIIAAADCTGHGVPGAFMSMLGISLLSEIVNKAFITDPGVILDQLRKEVISSLNQTGGKEDQKDGLDLSLITIDTETWSCQYAGANNPLYLIRHNELKEFKPDMMPISIYHRMEQFTTQDIQLESGDQLYLFSDGYADQFGGQHRKKFKYGAFRQLLLDHAGESMEQQQRVLTETISKWQGDGEQIDDMVVVGLKV
ncbi:MAG: SpoIIE family protein phosphatase [Bacteroidota bacterium]